jgi:hypothetical protein
LFSSKRRRLRRRLALTALAAVAVYSADAATAGLKLTHGRGTAVCDAYLQRLKQSHFGAAEWPFCGRPEDESVPGFQRLERRYLSETEALPLVNRVQKFMAVGDQNQVQRTYYSNAEHPELSHWSDDIELPTEILKYGSWTKVWTFRTPVDIENNGAPEPVLLWQGFPAATHKGGACGGAASGRTWDFPYMETRGFILSADGKTIDEAKTRAVFAAPAYVSSLETSSSRAATEHRVIPLGDSIGIMLFEGRYYIDAADRPVSKNAPLTYAVFLHQDGHTQKVCTLR